MNTRTACLALASFCTLLSGTLMAEEVCKPLDDTELSAHMLFVDKHGNLISPLTEKRVADERYYVQYMLERINTAKYIDGKKITIFIHGGLNTREGATDRPRKLTNCMLEAGTYPVFIGWSAGPFSNYGDHLLGLRRGRSQSLWAGIPSAPFILLEDIARSAVRALPALYKEASDPFDVVRQISRTQLVDAMKSEDRQLLKATVNDAKKVGVNLLTSGEGVLTSYWSAANPAKLISAPLVDGVGTGIWESLLRRTDFVLNRSADYEGSVPIDPADPHHADTAVTSFLKALEIQKDISTISLIGHSMGTFVATNILARHPDLNISHVVFMGAAAPLKSLEHVVAPWLAEHKQANFYNLSLDPDLEISESLFFDMAPRGSLLNWIDGTLASVNSFKDRTAGSWNNIAQTADEIFAAGCDKTTVAATNNDATKDKEAEKLRRQADSMCVKDRVHLTRFGIGPYRGPQKHGEFDEYCFWQPEYWQPTEGKAVLPLEACASLAKASGPVSADSQNASAK